MFIDVGTQTRQVPFGFSSGVLSHLCWGQTAETTQGSVGGSHDPGHSHGRDHLYLAGWVPLFMESRELVCGSSSDAAAGSELDHVLTESLTQPPKMQMSLCN